MKRLLFIIIICVMACLLLSCRSKQKAVISTDQNSALSYADTTKIVADNNSYTQNDTDTTKTAAAYDGVGLIEFIDGGGKVSIDSAGNVTFDGVKNIKGRRTESITQNNGVAKKTEEAAGHREQLNGVKADQTKLKKSTEKNTPAQKWYETAFARIGLGVCIAALMWLLFLYLKRRF